MNQNSKIRTFTDLNVWKEGHVLVIKIYQITKKFPREEVFSLIDQMRRAATSITCNVAEGLGESHIRRRYNFITRLKGHLLN